MALRPRPAEAEPPPAGGGPDPQRFGARPMASALVTAWAVPYLCDLLHLDVLLIPLIVLAFASILRTGTALLDRLVVAVLIVCGVILVTGLVTSLTPVRMLPAPSAAILLTIAVVATWVGRRRPTIPLRFRGSDLLVAGAGAVTLYYVHKPLGGLSPLKQLMYSATVEDRFQHFAIFDKIHTSGGYGFYHRFNASYPQGLHYLLAWIDTFVRSSADPGPSLAEFQRYFGYVQILFVFLTVAVVWAARWVAEPFLRGWRAIVACTAVAAFLADSDFVSLIPAGFDAEVLGLALIALAAALMIRPASSAWEHLAIGGAATIAVAYTYNAYAVFVVGFFVCSTVIYRRRYQGKLRLVAIVYAGVLAVAVLPTLLSVLQGFDYQAQALVSVGYSMPVDKSLLAAFVFVVLAALASPAARRIPRPGAAAAVLVVSVLVVGVFAAWQTAQSGTTSYYTSKFLAAAFVIALTAIPVIGFLVVSTVSASEERTRGQVHGLIHGRVRRAWLAAGFCAAALSLAGGVQWGIPGVDGAGQSWQGSALVKWSTGSAKDGTELAIAAFFQRHGIELGSKPVIVLSGNAGYGNYRQTRFYGILQRQSQQGVTVATPILSAKLGGPVTNERDFQDGLAKLESAIRLCAVPPVIVIGDPATADRVTSELALQGLSATVVLMSS